MRKLDVGSASGVGSGALTALKTVSLPSIDELCFDGSYLWALDATNEVLYRRHASRGSPAGSFSFGFEFGGSYLVRFHPGTVRPMTVSKTSSAKAAWASSTQRATSSLYPS